MSDLPRIAPSSPARIPPVRPTRRSDEEPRRKPTRRRKRIREEASEESPTSDESPPEVEDGSGDTPKGSSINVRV